MRIDLAAFTDRGLALATTIAHALTRDGDSATVARPGRGVPLRDWAERAFREADALLFVGAVGIAARAVAPFVRDKTADPAVVAIDDNGRFAVAVLSSHVGGANALAERVAVITGAVPVVTTATDNAGVFAVDTWAVRNNLAIINPHAIKYVSAKLLHGDGIVIESAYPVSGSMPDNVVLRKRVAGDNAVPDVIIDVTKPTNVKAEDTAGDGETTTPLRLAPRALVLGSGCRRGTPATAIAAAFDTITAAAGIHPKAGAALAS
ncbi:MAG: cobalamin biosynthesis protein, partial [Planctomycetes bacterium]|nr:cobalamin biosynthesis protein [Planctomycetota bacterium]